MRDNRHAHLAHAQYCNLRETLGDSLFATIISVALSIVAMPLACSYLDFSISCISARSKFFCDFLSNIIQFV